MRSAYRPSAEEVFRIYLSYPGNTELLQEATDIQAEVLDMGQGVYLRFEARKEFVVEFLEYSQEKPDYHHYPFASVSCQELYDIPSPVGSGAKSGTEWWRPREVTRPECYVTKECEYLLFDTESQTVYYWYRPDFLGKDFYCVNDEGERETVPR